MNENNTQYIGIPGLDDELGTIPNGINLLLSYDPGTYPELFAYHFIKNSIDNGLHTFYFTTDKPKQDVKNQMKFVGLNTEDNENDIVFIDSYTPRFYHMLPDDVIKNLNDSELQNLGINSLNLFKGTIDNKCNNMKCNGVVDNLSSLLRENHPDDVIETLTHLKLKSSYDGSINLLIMAREIHDNQAEKNLMNICDGVIELRFDEYNDEIHRNLLIRNIVNKLVPCKKIPYNITQDGILVNDTKNLI